MLKWKAHLIPVAAALLAVSWCSAQDQPGQEARLEVTNVQFEPLQQGKNVVHVQVKNTSDQDQVFRTNIGTQSPDYGIGWGTGFFRTIPASQMVPTRFVFKIQGPMTESTSIRLTFSNPGPREGFQEEVWLQGTRPSFKKLEYEGHDLPWAPTESTQDQPASDEQARTVTEVFHRIQDGIGAKEYAQVWQLFTRDYQEAEFQGTDVERLIKAMEPNAPTDSAFHWERASFLGLQPVCVVQRAGKLLLLAETQGQSWTLDFAQEDGQWKLDWVAGYTPRALLWQNWPEYVLPRMKTHTTEHFDIYFFENSTAAKEIERIAQEKEKGYSQISTFLGTDPKLRITLVLFEDQVTKYGETGHQGMGMAYGNMIVEVYNQQESLDPFHETAHILAGRIGNPPALFREGFAVYMSECLGACALEDLGGGQASVDDRARELKTKGDWIDLAELISYAEIGSVESRPFVAYAEAASFVKFLIDTYGKDRFILAYTTLKNSKNRDVHARNTAELAAIYGRSLDELRVAWEGALMSNAERK